MDWIWNDSFKVSTLEICLWLLLALRMLTLNCSALHDKRNFCIGFYEFLPLDQFKLPVSVEAGFFQVILNTFKSCSEIFCFSGFLWQLMQIWKMAKYKTKEFHHLDTQDKNISNFQMWYLGKQPYVNKLFLYPFLQPWILLP